MGWYSTPTPGRCGHDRLLGGPDGAGDEVHPDLGGDIDGPRQLHMRGGDQGSLALGVEGPHLADVPGEVAAVDEVGHDGLLQRGVSVSCTFVRRKSDQAGLTNERIPTS
jgi:hypothetical protein